MKLLFILFILFIDVFAGTNNLYGSFKTAVESSLSSLWLLTKIAGFIILMWALSELIQSGKSGGADEGTKFFHFFLKVLLASIFVGTEKMYKEIMK